MPHTVQSLIQDLASDEKALKARLDAPLLVLSNVSVESSSPILETGTIDLRTVRSPGEAPVVEVRKRQRKVDAYPQGITVGHTDASDICLLDGSVSRFHAYFSHSAENDEWNLVDADSANGVWVDGLRLKPNAPTAVQDGSSIRFGSAVCLFFRPPSFLRYLRSMTLDSRERK